MNNTILAASWSELGRVSIWDLKTHLSDVEKRSTIRLRNNKKNKKPPPQGEVMTKPLYTFSGHLQEGYAMDWSSTVPGEFLIIYLRIVFDSCEEVINCNYAI